MEHAEDKKKDEPQKSHQISIIQIYGKLLSAVFID